MAYDLNSSGYVAYKAQSAKGSPASGTGANVLLIADGAQGGRLTKATIANPTVRSDGMTERGRHGSNRTAGSYPVALSKGRMDDILQAVMRGTWEAELTITEATASLTSITTGANTIVAAGGSWITAGLRVGDVIRLTGHSSSGNNGRNLRITGLTASTITVAETLTTNAVADTAFTVTRAGRRLVNGTTERYFTIEEHSTAIDASKVFQDCKWGTLRLQMQPNGVLMVTASWVGTGAMDVVSGGSAPYFTSPAEPTTVTFAVKDAVLRLGSSDLVDLLAFDCTIEVPLDAPDMAAATVAPDVFAGNTRINMSLTVLQSDYALLTAFDAETSLSLHLLAVEDEAEPEDFFSLVIPYFTLGGHEESARSNQAGGRSVTIQVPAELVGKDPTGGAYSGTMAVVQISNNS
jgi:hypothetical protein